MKASITRLHQLSNIPSASGIEIVKDKIFVIGDDSNYLFEIDFEGNTLVRTPLSKNNLESRIPKNIKPDFEAMTFLKIDGKPFLLIVGSGSLSPQRDSGILVSLINYSFELLDLGSFYTILKKELGPDDRKAFNIEGLCTKEDKLVFAQRGGITNNQFLFEVSIEQFVSYVKDEITNPKINVFQFSLPKVESIPNGISGCSMDNSGTRLFFCASAEQTANTYDDGEIKGSLLGMIEMEKGKEKIIKYCELNGPERTAKFKMESLAI